MGIQEDQIQSTKGRKRAVLCVNGQAPDRAVMQSLCAQSDFVLAADGGVNWLMNMGLEPDLVIGDLDSADLELISELEQLQIQDQYSTDIEKAMNYLIDHSYTHVDIVGLEGGRLDHLLSNFFLLLQYKDQMALRMMGNDWVGIYLRPKECFSIKQDSTVSLIPLSNVSGLDLEGFEYNLEDATFTLGQVGVSNVTKKPTVRISYKEGVLLGLFYDVQVKAVQ